MVIAIIKQNKNKYGKHILKEAGRSFPDWSLPLKKIEYNRIQIKAKQNQTSQDPEVSFQQVELDTGGNELIDNTAQEDEERRALDKRKYLALNRKCKEIEQVCVGLCSVCAPEPAF